MERKLKRGFTIIEMLVVIGIIVVLSGAGLVGYSSAIRVAQRTKGNELVHDAQVALVQALQNENSWPMAILKEGASGDGKMTSEVGASLVKRGLFSGEYEEREDENGAKIYRMTGLDKFGIVSPWAMAVIKQRINATSLGDNSRIPSGGTLGDHRLRFAVDDDYDGLTKVNVSHTGKGSATVRASACVWCCGYDGKFGTKDDIFSWTKSQEVK